MKKELRVEITHDERYADLYVNGYRIGQWYGGKEKYYLEPKKWAEKQIKKRSIVLQENIERMSAEIRAFEEELMAINSPTE